MEVVALYRCLGDRTRLRILNLLGQGPLCVCHFQEILGEPQVKVSKHLAYLKKHDLVRVTQEANWRIYRLVAKPGKVLEANLTCLQDSAIEDRTFRRDRGKLEALRRALGKDAPVCCTKPKPLKLKSA